MSYQGRMGQGVEVLFSDGFVVLIALLWGANAASHIGIMHGQAHQCGILPPCSDEFWLLPMHQKRKNWGKSFLTLVTSLWH